MDNESGATQTGRGAEHERIAKDPATPADTLLSLAHDVDPKIRALVAVNPATPLRSLLQLKDDPNPEVRARVGEALIEAAVPMNPATPPATLVQLAAHPDPKVRSWVAGNPSTPLASFIRLLADPDPQVQLSAHLASTRPERLAELEACDSVVMKRWSTADDERLDRWLASPENRTPMAWTPALIPRPGTVIETSVYWWGEWHLRKPHWWRPREGTGDSLARHVYCRLCHRDIGTYRAIRHDERKVYDIVAVHRLSHRAIDTPPGQLWRILDSG